jgi:hypothetical protein
VIPSERKLIAIPEKVLLAHMVEDAINTAFQQGKVGFRGIGGNVAPDKFFAAMLNHLVASRKIIANLPVSVQFISHNARGLVANLFDGTSQNICAHGCYWP